MKIKAHKLARHVLSTKHIKELGFSWENLFNPSNSIYTNRELNMTDIKLIGFDMDYTLAVYNKNPMESLQYDLAKEYLINNFMYSDRLKKYSFNQQLIIRGLVVDKYLGNILKLDDQNYVWRATHGKKELSKDEIIKKYGSKRIKIGNNQYYSLDTFFSVPEACLFIDTISCLYEQEHSSDFLKRMKDDINASFNFNLIFNEIRTAMDTIHADGSLKHEIVNNIHLYVQKNDEIYLALEKLKHEGKKLFLLTNSSYKYANIVLNHVFCSDKKFMEKWIDIFDFIIVEAQKPCFFTGTEPFICPLDGPDELTKKKVMSGGNIVDFHRMFGVVGQEVLYIGDHIYGDIMRSKKDSLWRTCLIVKELSFDIKTSMHNFEYFHELSQIRQEQALLDKRLMRLRMLLGFLKSQMEKSSQRQSLVVSDIKAQIKSITYRLQRLKSRYEHANRELENRFHPIWGRLFRESQELSRFGAQVRQYACIYTDHVRNFLHYGANHTFFAHKERMSHELDLG